MEKASKVMYSIANFFTWVIVILCIVGIVFSGLQMAGKLVEWGWTGEDTNPFLGLGSLITLIIVLIVCFITIAMVRRAKADNSSKAWDVFFIIVGIFQGNIFYILGGLFGLIAVRR
jgi:nitric oxide reductase large subunit